MQSTIDAQVSRMGFGGHFCWVPGHVREMCNEWVEAVVRAVPRQVLANPIVALPYANYVSGLRLWLKIA